MQCNRIREIKVAKNKDYFDMISLFNYLNESGVTVDIKGMVGNASKRLSPKPNGTKLNIYSLSNFESAMTCVRFVLQNTTMSLLWPDLKFYDL